MCQSKLFGAFFLFVTSVSVRCESGEDIEHPSGSRNNPDYAYDYSDYDRSPCENENENAMAEMKLEIEKLQQQLVGLRQKLDPDFQLPPSLILVKVEWKCPPGFQHVKLTAENRSCYKVVYEGHNWMSADQRCHDLYPEAHLVVITTDEENTAVSTYLRQELARDSRRSVSKFTSWGRGVYLLWTSGQRLNETSCADQFVWKISNNRQLPFSFTHWLDGEPNCHNNELEGCLHLRSSVGFKWNDVSCDQILYPLCEYDPL